MALETGITLENGLSAASAYVRIRGLGWSDQEGGVRFIASVYASEDARSEGRPEISTIHYLSNLQLPPSADILATAESLKQQYSLEDLKTLAFAIARIVGYTEMKTNCPELEGASDA